MTGKEDARSYFVESYWPGVREKTLAEAERRLLAETAEFRRRGQELRLVGSILIPVDETVFCLFEGVERDIRIASERAGVPVERVVESFWLDGSGGDAQEPK